MEAKLKALKVVQLKDIISKAPISLPAKANKQDLIAKIIASPPAIAVYNSIYNAEAQNTPSAVVSKPPPPQTKALTATPSEPAPSTKSKTQPSSIPSLATNQTVPESSEIAVSQDDELEKRKQRAARFGIPLVESKQQQKSIKSDNPSLSVEDEAKRAARAEKFGLNDVEAITESRKRSKPTESVDPQELERRKKRAERFGIPVVVA